MGITVGQFDTKSRGPPNFRPTYSRSLIRISVKTRSITINIPSSSVEITSFLLHVPFPKVLYALSRQL